MSFTRSVSATAFFFVGAGAFAIGVLLGLIKLMMLLAWHTWALICLAGLVLMLIGMALGAWRRTSANEIKDRIHHV